MKIDLESCLSHDDLKQGIASIIDDALRAEKKTDEQEQLLIYVANYARTNGELVSVRDLKDLFKNPVCELAILPARAKVEQHKKFVARAGYSFVIGVNAAAVLLINPNLLWLVPLSAGFGIWYWSRKLREADKQVDVMLYNFKISVADKLYSIFSEQTFKEMFDSVIKKYPALKERGVYENSA